MRCSYVTAHPLVHATIQFSERSPYWLLNQVGSQEACLQAYNLWKNDLHSKEKCARLRGDALLGALQCEIKALAASKEGETVKSITDMAKRALFEYRKACHPLGFMEVFAALESARRAFSSDTLQVCEQCLVPLAVIIAIRTSRIVEKARFMFPKHPFFVSDPLYALL